MTMGDVGTWVGSIGTLAAVAYALWHDRWGSLWWGPKLMLSFSPQRDIQNQANTVAMPEGGRDRWLRVRVENTPGRRAAKGCRGYLVGVSRLEPDGRWADVLSEDVRPLQWRHDEDTVFGARDILPGVPHWVDVVHTVDRVHGLITSSYPEWGIPGPGGTYLFTVKVVAEDAAAETIKLRVTWDGSWGSLTGTEVK